MRSLAARLVGILTGLLVLGSTLYSLIAGNWKWAVPGYVLFAGLMLFGAWHNRSRGGVVHVWWPVACAVLMAALIVDVLTGYVLPLMVVSVPCTVLAVAVTIRFHKAGYQIRRLL